MRREWRGPQDSRIEIERVRLGWDIWLIFNSGILGPPPLSAHPTWSSSTSSPPLLDRPNPPLPHLPHHRPRHLPNPERRGITTGLLPPPTLAPPASAKTSLRRSLHLHPSRSNPTDLRPRRLRPNSIQQTRVRLGHPKRLGQPPNLRSTKLSSSPQRRVHLPHHSPPKAKTLCQPTLAKNIKLLPPSTLPPLLPTPLPPVLFISSKGKAHLNLPQPKSSTISHTASRSPKPSHQTPPNLPVSAPPETANPRSRPKTNHLLRETPTLHPLKIPNLPPLGLGILPLPEEFHRPKHPPSPPRPLPSEPTPSPIPSHLETSPPFRFQFNKLPSLLSPPPPSTPHQPNSAPPFPPLPCSESDTPPPSEPDSPTSYQSYHSLPSSADFGEFYPSLTT